MIGRRTMQGAARLREVAGALFLHELRLIREFSLRHDTDGGIPALSLTLVLETEGRAPDVRVTLTFSCVSSLRLDLTRTHMWISGFDVRDISDRQWDGIRWEVVDSEDDALHFYCREAQVDAVELLRSHSG